MGLTARHQLRRTRWVVGKTCEADYTLILECNVIIERWWFFPFRWFIRARDIRRIACLLKMFYRPLDILVPARKLIVISVEIGVIVVSAFLADQVDFATVG